MGMHHSKCKFSFKTNYGMNSELRNKGPAEEHLRGTDVMSVAAALLWPDRADLHSVGFLKMHSTTLPNFVSLPIKAFCQIRKQTLRF